MQGGKAVIKALTIRNLPPALAEALEREKRRRGTSLNQTVIDLLGQGLGSHGVRSNGLSRLAGGWSEDEFHDFERATAQFERVDEELWS
jgi:plasmid stability protein